MWSTCICIPISNAIFLCKFCVIMLWRYFNFLISFVISAQFCFYCSFGYYSFHTFTSAKLSILSFFSFSALNARSYEKIKWINTNKYVQGNMKKSTFLGPLEWCSCSLLLWAFYFSFQSNGTQFFFKKKNKINNNSFNRNKWREQRKQINLSCCAH